MKNKIKIAHKIRGATIEDKDFIYNTFLKQVKDLPEGRYIHPEIFYPEYTAILDKLIQRCNVNVIVDPDDDSHIYGYAITELKQKVPVLHFVYIKGCFRRYGLAEKLVTSIIPGFGKETVFTSFVPFNKGSDTFFNTKQKFKLEYSPFLRS